MAVFGEYPTCAEHPNHTNATPLPPLFRRPALGCRGKGDSPNPFWRDFCAHYFSNILVFSAIGTDARASPCAYFGSCRCSKNHPPLAPPTFSRIIALWPSIRIRKFSCFWSLRRAANKRIANRAGMPRGRRHAIATTFALRHPDPADPGGFSNQARYSRRTG